MRKDLHEEIKELMYALPTDLLKIQKILSNEEQREALQFHLCELTALFTEQLGMSDEDIAKIDKEIERELFGEL